MRKAARWNQAALIESKAPIEENIQVPDDAPRCCELGHFEIPLSISLQMRAELRGENMYFGFRSERPFSRGLFITFLCRSSTSSGGKAAHTGQERTAGGASERGGMI